MTRHTLLASIVITIAALSLPPTADGADACQRTKFETKLVADACKSGGTPAAKDAMKKWVKQAKAKQPGLECASCHSKMAPSYELKKDALATYKRLGGQ